MADNAYRPGGTRHLERAAHFIMAQIMVIGNLGTRDFLARVNRVLIVSEV